MKNGASTLGPTQKKIKGQTIKQMVSDLKKELKKNWQSLA